MTDQSDRPIEQAPSAGDADDTSAPAAGTTDAQGARERRGPPPNPLYHPLFLPTLLVGFTLWFGYDGFLTSDPEMLEHQTFNRVCFALTLLFCLRVVPRGIREYRQEQAEAAKRQEGGDPAA